MRLNAKWFLPLLCVSSLWCYAVLSASTWCENGELNEEGACECQSCWSGHDCASYANSKPRFSPKKAEIYLNDPSSGSPIYTAEAYDPDEALCTEIGECPCSTITYSIAGQNGESNFRIDKIRGDVYTMDDFSPLFKRYTIRILASNEDGNNDDMTLEIYTDKTDVPSNVGLYSDMTSEDSSANFVPHHRQKRAITLPSEVTFNLVKTGAHENETEIKVGTRIEFQLDIVFPAGSTDMQVELFTPDTTTVVMMLCNVQVVKGDNLAISGSFEPDLESRDNNNIMDRAVIALGTVTNDGSDLSTEIPSTFTVTYEAVMIENTDTVNAAKYWVSAGAEFNNSRDIWVGQASFTASTDDDSATFTTTPDFNFTGPTELAIGASSLFLLDIMLPYPIIDVKVDIFAAINVSDAMSICSGKLLEVSEGYQCGLGNLSDFEPQFHADGNTKTHGRVNWNLGRPINKLAREVADISQHFLSFGVIIKMEDNTNLVGNDYVVGAAVEIGTDKIWAGQLTIRAAAKPTSSVASPALSVISSSHTLSQNVPTEIEIELDIQELTSAEYKLEIMMPFMDGQSVLQICTVNVGSIGNNLGCLDSSAITSELIRTDPNSTLADRAIFTLGTVSNVGTWGWYLPGEEAIKNKMVLTMMAISTDHPAATLGSTHNITIGLHVGDTRMTVTSVQVEIVADTTVSTISSEKTPDFDMFFNDGTDNLPIGSISRVSMEVTTKRNTIYQPFHVEFIMPNNTGTSMLSLCKVELSSVGRNIPCLLKDSVDFRTELVSSFEDGVMDRSLIHLPVLCNQELINDTAEDKFQMQAVFKVLDHDGFDSGDPIWISGGVRYSAYNLWVGQISITGDSTPQTYTLDTTPYLAVVPSNSTWTGVPHGYPASYLVRIKLNFNETSTLKVNVSTTGNALSICGLRVLRTGDSYYCMDYAGTMPVFDEPHDTFGNIKRASFDLGVIKNFGENPISQNSDFDENTIEMEVIVTMTPNTAVAADLSTHDLDVLLIYDTSEQTIQDTETITAVVDTSFVESMLSTGLTASAYSASISGTDTLLGNETLTDIVLSESKRIVIDVNTVQNSVSKISVTVSSPTASTNVMSVEYIGVLDAGSNLGCVNAKLTLASYTPRVGSETNDMGTLLFPYVCNRGDNSSTEASLLRVEAIIRLMPFAAVSVGDVLTINAAVNINDEELGVYTTDLSVADTAAYIDIYRDDVTVPGDVGIMENTTESTITMSIGEKKVIPVVFTIPSYTSSMIWFDAAMPANDTLGSALITVNDVVLTRNGRNLPNLLAKEMMTLRSSSHFNTSQMTKTDISLGIITNPGIRQRMGDYEINDDTFTVEFTLQMADHDDSQDAAVHQISFGLHVAKYIFILEVPITVSRTGSENLVFNVSTSLDEVNSTSSDVYVDSFFALADTSTLEGTDSVFKFFLPPYLEYVQSVINTPHKEFTNIDHSHNVVTFEFGPLFFTDDIHMTTNLRPNSTYRVPPGITGINSVLKFQAITNSRAVTDFSTEMDYVNFTVTTTPQSGVDCVPAALGMASSSIQDCQITSSRDSITEAYKGRYGTSTAWTPFVHSGKVSEERYLQVYFGNKTVVNSVHLQQDGTAMATKITIRHSDDGVAWVENSDNVITVDPVLNDQELFIPVPQPSRYIRIMMTELNANVQSGAFRFELSGCHVTNDAPADLCSAPAPSILSDFNSRTFLATSTAVYVCDGRQGNLDIEQRCIASPDGTTWAEVDPRVGAMVGHDSAEPRVYAVSSDGLVHMSSTDGIQWETSVPDDVTIAKALPTFKAATTVPLKQDSTLEQTNPHPTYTDGIYGATSVGLKKNTGGPSWETVCQWSSCCP